MKIYALRLVPGQDLRRSLEAFARDRPLSAGCILTAVGSLQPAVLRFAGCDAVTECFGPVELIALSGTLAPEGVHLHGAIADQRGRVRGGHIAPGCLVYTTVELVLGDCWEWQFRRVLDPQTGYLELAIEARTEAD